MLKTGLIMYHLVVYCTFTALYFVSDMQKGFAQANETKRNDVQFAAYYSLVTHATIGYGDCFPTKPSTQLLVMGHIFCVLLPTFFG